MKPARPSWASLVGSTLGLLLLTYGGIRFLNAGFLPATRMLRGDFAAVFPTAYFARLRPDFPTEAWPGWMYGPMLHFLTLPLFLVPRWSMVPTVWALTNLAALTLSFVLVCRLSGAARQVPGIVVVTLAGLWLLFQPLANCLASGNIEIIEMALILGAVVALQSSRARASGVLIGVAAMLKFLPIGFLGWFVLRRQWRAALATVATIAVIIAVTTVTLGWKEGGFRRMSGAIVVLPQGGLHELSVTSLFIHRAGVLDYEEPTVRWFPWTRLLTAARAGALASALLASGFALLLFARRRDPVSAVEIAVLFMTMFMILPWNHDYYYLFALVPLSVLFLKAAAARDWTLMTITIAGYLLISPPVPFGWIDRTGWLPLPFAYLFNYHDVPVAGGLLLWFAATHQFLIQPRDATAPRARRGLPRRAAIVAVPAVIALACAFLWFGRKGNAASSTTTTLSVQPPLRLTGGPGFAVSPDGSRLAYIDQAGVLCVRKLDRPATTCWSETREATGPFFSASGRWIGFFASGALKKVPAAGGPVTDIARGIDGTTGEWSYDPELPAFGRDGAILFASPDGIYRIADAGGDPQLVIPSHPGEGRYLWPTMATGEMVIFTIAPREGGSGPGAIWAQSLTTGRRQLLLPGSQPHFDRATAQLIYTLGGRVLAVACDPVTLSLSGVSVPLAGNVLVTADGGAQFALSGEGTLVYTPGSPDPAVRRRLLWVDRQGSADPLPIPANAFEGPRLSPDGRTVVAAIRDVISDMWMYDRASGAATRLMSGGASSPTPVWAPGGRAVSFVEEGPRVLSTPIEAAALPPATLWGARPWESHEPVRLSDWSRDGRLLAGSQRGDLWVLDVTSAGQAVLIQTPSSERDPVFSPDGRWIAYSSDTSGSPEIYVRAYPGLAEPQRVTSEGGAVEPVWSRDGRELFYRRLDWVMAVSVTTGSTFTAGPSRPLFEGKFATGSSIRDYDVSPDGQHFLMVSRESQSDSIPREIRVLRNWSAKLKH
jgi:hypothetical protein